MSPAIKLEKREREGEREGYWEGEEIEHTKTKQPILSILFLLSLTPLCFSHALSLSLFLSLEWV